MVGETRRVAEGWVEANILDRTSREDGGGLVVGWLAAANGTPTAR